MLLLALDKKLHRLIYLCSLQKIPQNSGIFCYYSEQNCRFEIESRRFDPSDRKLVKL